MIQMGPHPLKVLIRCPVILCNENFGVWNALRKQQQTHHISYHMSWIKFNTEQIHKVHNLQSTFMNKERDLKSKLKFGKSLKFETFLKSMGYKSRSFFTSANQTKIIIIIFFNKTEQTAKYKL